jgi:hypothetical protein
MQSGQQLGRENKSNNSLTWTRCSANLQQSFLKVLFAQWMCEQDEKNLTNKFENMLKSGKP